MSPYLLRSALAALFSSALSLASSSAAAPPSLETYIAAWVSPERVNLKTVLAPEATYYDSDWGREVSREDFELFRRGLLGLGFTLLRQTTLEDGRIELHWSVTDARDTWTSLDTLTLVDGHITGVVSEGSAAAERDVAWVDRFVAARKSLDGKAFGAFMDPQGRIVGSSLPTGGYSVEGFIGFMGTIRGTVYERLAGTEVRRAKDGHLYYEFHVLLANGTAVVAGTDHLVQKNGLITLFEGVY